MTTESDNWYAIREQTLERDHHTCRRCGKLETECYRSLDVHHIIPIIQGGSDELDNFITVCPGCHPSEEARGKYGEHIKIVARTFHIPEELDKQLKIKAAKARMRFSEVAVLALEEYLK